MIKEVKTTDGFRLLQEAISLPSPDSNTLRLSVSSTLPIKRTSWDSGGDYWEILGHTPENIDLNRLENNALPLLFNHDVQQHIGIVKTYDIDGDRAYSEISFGSNPLALEKKQDVADGILTSCSVRYKVAEYQKTGEIEGTPVFTATLWEPIEVSLVTTPGDPSVGVGRSLDGSDINKSLQLEQYSARIVPELVSRSSFETEYALESYLPESGTITPSTFFAAFEVANRSIQKSGLQNSQKALFYQRNNVGLQTYLRQHYHLDAPMATTKEESQKIEQTTSLPNPEIEELRSLLTQERAARESEKLERENLTKLVEQQTIKSGYLAVRSQFETLVNVTHQITPAQFNEEFALDASEDFKKISDGTFDVRSLDQLTYLCGKYSKMEKRNIGVTPNFVVPKTEELGASELKIAKDKSSQFSRSLNKSATVL